MRVLVDLASDGGPVGIPIIVGVSCGCVRPSRQGPLVDRLALPSPMRAQCCEAAMESQSEAASGMWHQAQNDACDAGTRQASTVEHAGRAVEECTGRRSGKVR